MSAAVTSNQCDGDVLTLASNTYIKFWSWTISSLIIKNGTKSEWGRRLARRKNKTVRCRVSVAKKVRPKTLSKYNIYIHQKSFWAAAAATIEDLTIHYGTLYGIPYGVSCNEFPFCVRLASAILESSTESIFFFFAALCSVVCRCKRMCV